MRNAILIICAVVVGGLLCLVGLSVFLRHKTTEPLSQPPSHGVAFLIEAADPPGKDATNNFAMLKSALLKRADRVGVRIYWEPVSDARVRVVVATGPSGDGDNLQRALFRQGRLELRLVHEYSDRLIEAGEISPGYEMLKRELRRPPLAGRVDKVVVKRKPERGLSGSVIQRAMVTRGNLGEPEISFRMQPEASAAFAKVTRDNVGRRLAIVIDGELFSAPTIVSPIETGNGMITGQSDLPEAVQLAGALECPLPFSIKVVETKSF